MLRLLLHRRTPPRVRVASHQSGPLNLRLVTLFVHPPEEGPSRANVKSVSSLSATSTGFAAEVEVASIVLIGTPCSYLKARTSSDRGHHGASGEAGREIDKARYQSGEVTNQLEA